MNSTIHPCLWFDSNAKAAVDYYCAIFKNSRIVSENPVVVIFEINDYRIMALNGRPQLGFTDAVSLVVNCATQEEIDHYWNSLIADGGEESMCGWLKDKYGFSWQIVPSELGQLMSNPERGQRVMKLLVGMRKLDLEALRNA